MGVPSRPHEDNRENEDIPQIIIDHGATEPRDDVESPAGFMRGNHRVVASINGFFVEEWKAFKRERCTPFYKKELFPANLDFDAMREEWLYRPDNPAHWKNQKKKKN